MKKTITVPLHLPSGNGNEKLPNPKAIVEKKTNASDYSFGRSSLFGFKKLVEPLLILQSGTSEKNGFDINFTTPTIHWKLQPRII